MSDTDAKKEELQKAFKEYDSSGDGRLIFEDFMALLRRGNKDFKEAQAETLFEICDQDMSGTVDFDELVEFIFNRSNMDKLFIIETKSDEEEAKQILLGKPAPVRRAASKAVKQRGDDWGKMTWRERLEVLLEIEKGELEGDQMMRSMRAPLKDPSCTLKVPKRKPHADKGSEKSPKSPMKEQADRPKTAEQRRKSVLDVDKPATKPTPATVSGGLPPALKQGKFGIAEMSQVELVNYSLQSDDLSFAGRSADVRKELMGFRDYLCTAGSPLDDVDVLKYIAKGTAGWVFLCENKETKNKCAMKFIRMTQARSGIKEWYCSKVVRNLTDRNGEQNIVFTDEKVHVLQRSTAPDIIKEQLANAGPVDFYLAMTQELMPWGTLEDLEKEGELSPEVMFKCLEDVSVTLAMMHANGLQHRDVKPENIMLVMDDDDTVVSAKLCDMGSAMVGNEPGSCEDDIRRFGVTLFSVATGEGWLANRLIRAKHEDLVARLTEAVEGSSDPTMLKLPQYLEQILSGKMTMEDIAQLMSDLADNYDEG
jgi:hypothetical protein